VIRKVDGGAEEFRVEGRLILSEASKENINDRDELFSDLLVLVVKNDFIAVAADPYEP
jgi:hypothetical protein